LNVTLWLRGNSMRSCKRSCKSFNMHTMITEQGLTKRCRRLCKSLNMQTAMTLEFFWCNHAWNHFWETTRVKTSLVDFDNEYWPQPLLARP
jgi:hypothetical protein